MARQSIDSRKVNIFQIMKLFIRHNCTYFNFMLDITGGLPCLNIAGLNFSEIKLNVYNNINTISMFITLKALKF
jgi:hypothetical protein